jgi:hypothetical protein
MGAGQVDNDNASGNRYAELEVKGDGYGDDDSIIIIILDSWLLWYIPIPSKTHYNHYHHP